MSRLPNECPVLDSPLESKPSLHTVTYSGLNKITSSSWNSWPKFPLLTEDGDTLNVRGIVFDYVRLTSNVFSPATPMDEIGRFWRSISGMETVTVYPQHNREKIFLQTLE